MNWFLFAAGVLMTLTTFIHIVIGGRMDYAAFETAEIKEPEKSTIALCWHLISAVLAALAVAFFLASFGKYTQNACAASALCLILGLVSIAVAIKRERSPLSELPQGIGFLVIAGLGFWGTY